MVTDAGGDVMADKQIIFSAPMVNALLDGRKTQTRRILPADSNGRVPCFHDGKRSGSAKPDLVIWPFTCAPYAPGDRLWCKETFQTGIWRGQDTQVTYRATMEWPWDGPWRSPIFMPRKLSRLTLIVTDVRVQRLQEIKGRDIIAEGVRCKGCHDVGVGGYSACRDGGCFGARNAFRDLWNSLHGPDAWGANPWVVALTFTVHRGNIDQMGVPA